MKIYEGMFLVDSRKANRDWDAVLAHVNALLQKCGATVHRAGKWAERRLAYPIKKHTRGVYVLTYFETPDQEGVITEINRQAQISDTILRALVLRVKEIPKEIPVAPAEEDERSRGRRDSAGSAPAEPVKSAAAEETAAPAPRPATAGKQAQGGEQRRTAAEGEAEKP